MNFLRQFVVQAGIHLANWGLTAQRQGERERAGGLAQASLSYATKSGEVRATEDSQAHQKRSATILTEIDNVEGLAHPEIWKLVEW